MRRYADRYDAGRALGELLGAYANREDVLVLALPRGGVPVAFEVARALGGAPLDVFLVRKLGVPGHEELAMGAVATGGVRVVNDAVVRGEGVTAEEVEETTLRERAELERRERAYRDDLPFPDLDGRTVLLVDDGLATGTTMRAAVLALRAMGPARIVVAVPVASPDTCAELRSEVDDIICAHTPDPFIAVGLWYQDFSQTSDDEVRDLLFQARRAEGRGVPGAEAAPPVSLTDEVGAGSGDLGLREPGSEVPGPPSGEPHGPGEGQEFAETVRGGEVVARRRSES